MIDMLRKTAEAHPYLTCAAALGGFTLTFSGCGVSFVDYGEPVENITEVTIDDGGVVREDPYIPTEDDSRGQKVFSVDLVDSDTFKTAPESVAVATPEGVYMFDDVKNNGVWYGVSAEDFKATIAKKNKDLREKLDNDPDGIVWVNEQRAQPTVDLEATE